MSMIRSVLNSAIVGGLMISATGTALAANCASLPASRATEFHGDPANNDLALAMAGNQWVVFDQVLRAFNESRGLDNSTPIHKDGWTSADYDNASNRYFVELIPPGQEKDQIKSGCMNLGNEKSTNFMPLVIRTNFDVFTSTNYNLMQTLGTAGYVSEALPYTKNKLTLMVAAGNPAGIGEGGSDLDRVFDATMDLLSASIVVSEVDHINEGVHKGINVMYQAMDRYIRINGTGAMISSLDSALSAVANPQDGSPAQTRTINEGITTNFNLATNAACHYQGDADIADGTLRFCEFAVLNKANTHETRVHHVETPSGILGKNGYVPVDVGPVWVSELQFANNAGDAVDGSMMPDAVNEPVIYSVAVLSTNEAGDLAQEFVDFLRDPNKGDNKNGGNAQKIYEAGGFLHMCYGVTDPAPSCHEPGGIVHDDFNDTKRSY